MLINSPMEALILFGMAIVIGAGWGIGTWVVGKVLR